MFPRVAPDGGRGRGRGRGTYGGYALSLSSLHFTSHPHSCTQFAVVVVAAVHMVVVNVAVAASMASVVAVAVVVAAVSMVVVVNEAVAPVTMAMVLVAKTLGLVVAVRAVIVRPLMVALTMEGSVAEVTPAAGAVSLSRPVHLPSGLVATLSRRAAIPPLHSQYYQVIGQALSQPST